MYIFLLYQCSRSHAYVYGWLYVCIYIYVYRSVPFVCKVDLENKYHYHYHYHYRSGGSPIINDTMWRACDAHVTRQIGTLHVSVIAHGQMECAWNQTETSTLHQKLCMTLSYNHPYCSPIITCHVTWASLPCLPWYQIDNWSLCTLYNLNHSCLC